MLTERIAQCTRITLFDRQGTRISALACRAVHSKHSTASLSSKAAYMPGDVVVGSIISTGPKGSRVELHHGGTGFLPHHLDPLHLQCDMYVQNNTSNQQSSLHDPKVGLVREFLVRKCEADRPMLSAQHLDYDILYKRAQQVAALCEDQVLSARVTSWSEHGLHVCCLGTEGFIPLKSLPKSLVTLCVQQRGQELVGTQLPVLVEKVQPQQRRMRLNCRAALAAKRAALQPADLVTGVVTEVHDRYAWIALSSLDQDGFKAKLHRSSFSVQQSFDRLQDVLQVGEAITAMVLSNDEQGRRVKLSTAHLEILAGDMLYDRQAVYATAAQQVQIVRAQMAQAAQSDTAAQDASGYIHEDQVETAPLQQQQIMPVAATADSQQLHHDQQLQTAHQQHPAKDSKLVRVLIPDSLYQLAMASSGYLSGMVSARPAAVVMAAAVWQGAPADGGDDCISDMLGSFDPEQDWWSKGPLAWRAAEEKETWAAEQQLVTVKNTANKHERAGRSDSDSGAGDVLSSIDPEQDWWSKGPLAWRHAEEKERWAAEQQFVNSQASKPKASADATSTGACSRGVEGAWLGRDGLDAEQQWLQPPLHWDQAY